MHYFVKTCKRDISRVNRLISQISLCSLSPYRLTVVADEDCAESVNHSTIIAETAFPELLDVNPYLAQQWIKLNAFKYATGEVMLIDSDYYPVRPYYDDQLFSVKSKYDVMSHETAITPNYPYIAGHTKLFGVPPTKAYLINIPCVVPAYCLEDFSKTQRYADFLKFIQENISVSEFDTFFTHVMGTADANLFNEVSKQGQLTPIRRLFARD